MRVGLVCQGGAMFSKALQEHILLDFKKIDVWKPSRTPNFEFHMMAISGLSPLERAAGL